MTIGRKCAIGGRYVFRYPHEFTTLPEYESRRGSVVEIVRQHTQEEADQGNGMERMYLVRAADGWQGSAWASELEAL